MGLVTRCTYSLLDIHFQRYERAGINEFINEPENPINDLEFQRQGCLLYTGMVEEAAL